MTPSAPSSTELALPAHVAPAFAGATVLITGGAGFIGGHIAHAAAALGARVRVMDDLSGGTMANVPAGAEFIQADVRDTAAVSRAVAGCRFVFHQAAMVSVPVSVEKPAECLAVNVVATDALLAACAKAGVQRVMFAASAAAYGNEPRLPCREDQNADAWSPYAMSKVTGELLCQSYSRCFGLSTAALRYFNVYGERQNPNSAYAAVISAFHKALTTGVRAKIFGDGKQTRDFVHVLDVVRANLLAAACQERLAGRPMNIGTGVKTDLRTVLSRMAEALGVAGEAGEPEFHPARAGDIRESVADISLAGRVLGYAPTQDFASGIRRMLERSGGAVKTGGGR
ncbi:MAG: NAD-dependent epimerase/dehydratase family protein [Planctomycetaceae bacterium]|jgi:nucleoside-diphosphate-sugar epimerase|nr:NAD-dependent epimerase/dehydratase family protein [Phycisphaerales bacterium]MCE2653814.1 NAD-dependent epimerase/dehydratase family protein [Planctomycetaceae bacterium]